MYLPQVSRLFWHHSIEELAGSRTLSEKVSFRLYWKLGVTNLEPKAKLVLGLSTTTN